MEVKQQLKTDGFIHLKNFFTEDLCSNFLNENKHLLDIKQDASIKGSSVYGDILIKENIFYGKKSDCWEAFKLDIDKKDNKIFPFAEKLFELQLGSFWSSQFLIKKRFLKDVLPCHRDNQFDESIRYYNCGIYLTDSCAQDAVYFYPKTHLEKDIDYSSMEKVFITAKKGDVLIHDSYAWHGSLNDVNEGRATLYIKFKELL